MKNLVAGRRSVAPTGTHDIANTKGGFVRILVFPDPEAHPSGVSELLVGVTVTRDVAFHFVGPELGVRHGNGVVLRAPVPKASIEEDRNFCLREYEVGRAPQIL